MKNQNEGLSWLLTKLEHSSDRYIEAESFIIELSEMKWYQRIFISKKIIRFLQSREY